MRATLLSFVALFSSCFILLTANGLINVLMPVRMGLEQIDTDTIGLVQSFYFLGVLIGALLSKKLIIRAGHTRMFAGCVAIGAISILVSSLYENLLLWGAMRVVIGFCNASAFTAMESWLSYGTTSKNRGKVLAVYNAIMLAGLFTGQFLLNLGDPMGTELFVISGILLCMAIIPIAWSRNPGPYIEDVASMSLIALYRVSPLGVVTCVVAGAIYAAIFNLLPVFANDNGIVDFELSLYMGAAILGAFLLQYPIGWLSDTFDRRSVLLGITILSAFTCLFITMIVPQDHLIAVFVATGICCGIIACTYPLSISETFDKLEKHELISAMSSLVLAFALGGIAGPYTASVVMKVVGSDGLFYFLAFSQIGLAAFVVYRMMMRQALPLDEQEQFVMQGGSLTGTLVELDPRTPD